jgi:hypothetical protein
MFRKSTLLPSLNNYFKEQRRFRFRRVKQPLPPPIIVNPDIYSALQLKTSDNPPLSSFRTSETDPVIICYFKIVLLITY